MRLYAVYLYLTAYFRSRQLINIVREFQPQAILTDVHGFSWITASAIADKFKLPLHVSIQDDWPHTTLMPRSLHWYVNWHFKKAFRKAKSRLCVSPYMVSAYEERYGIGGTILYPSRSISAPNFNCPPEAREASKASPIVAYAGSLSNPSYVRSLITLASVLENTGGKVFIYSAETEERIKHMGLQKNNIVTCPLLPFNKLIETLRSEVDILFVPMSFESQHRSNMEQGFPCKLSDYTAVGLPILIWGPPYCSAVRWAKENPGVAEVIDEENVEKLRVSLCNLIEDSEYRYRLGAASLVVGRKYFSNDVTVSKFNEALTS